MMQRMNQFHFEPGLYENKDDRDLVVVVTELVTHSDKSELGDPLVVFRDLEIKVEKYVRYSMRLSEFKTKYKIA